MNTGAFFFFPFFFFFFFFLQFSDQFFVVSPPVLSFTCIDVHPSLPPTFLTFKHRNDSFTELDISGILVTTHTLEVICQHCRRLEALRMGEKKKEGENTRGDKASVCIRRGGTTSIRTRTSLCFYYYYFCTWVFVQGSRPRAVDRGAKGTANSETAPCFGRVYLRASLRRLLRRFRVPCVHVRVFHTRFCVAIKLLQAAVA